MKQPTDLAWKSKLRSTNRTATAVAAALRTSKRGEMLLPLISTLTVWSSTANAKPWRRRARSKMR
jgi:hypothetical protein